MRIADVNWMQLEEFLILAELIAIDARQAADAANLGGPETGARHRR